MSGLSDSPKAILLLYGNPIKATENPKRRITMAKVQADGPSPIIQTSKFDFSFKFRLIPLF